MVRHDSQTICEELKSRIEDDLAFFGDGLPENQTIAWRAYLAALLEWDVISVGIFDYLTALLPNIEDDPVPSILLGRS